MFTLSNLCQNVDISVFIFVVHTCWAGKKKMTTNEKQKCRCKNGDVVPFYQCISYDGLTVCAALIWVKGQRKTTYFYNIQMNFCGPCHVALDSLVNRIESSVHTHIHTQYTCLSCCSYNETNTNCWLNLSKSSVSKCDDDDDAIYLLSRNWNRSTSISFIWQIWYSFVDIFIMCR